jgi:hypothetical protein
LRAKKGKARSFKAVEPEAAIMVSPEQGKKKRPPTARQVALWMNFKKEQRLEWQQNYLTHLCERDPQIAQTYELIQEFTTMLRERGGNHLDEWLDRVEKQGVPELQSFAEATEKRLRRGESKPHPLVEQRPDGGAGTSLKAHEETNVWPGQLHALTSACSASG